MMKKNNRKKGFAILQKSKQTYIQPLAKLPNGLLLLSSAAQIIEGKLFEPIDASSKKNFKHSPELSPFIPFKK